MTACVNCARALQPAWKYCIFCGTRTAVAATAPRSRPLPAPAAGSEPASGPRRASAPARTSVPALSTSSTAQTPIVPVGAPAPLAAAPSVPPVSSEWPETLGERPSLRSALAATEVPSPTPPAATAPAPTTDDEDLEPAAVEAAEEALTDADAARVSIADLAAGEADATGPEAVDEPEPEPETEPDAASQPDPEPSPRRPRGPRRRPAASTGTLVEDAPATEAPVADAPATHAPAKASKKKAPIKVFPDEEVAEAEPEVDSDEIITRVDRVGRVNLLAVLALLLGVLASPLAALFGHVALSQLRASGERGVIPAWIAIVLGYLWLGFFLVLGITYLATNG